MRGLNDLKKGQSEPARSCQSFGRFYLFRVSMAPIPLQNHPKLWQKCASLGGSKSYTLRTARSFVSVRARKSPPTARTSVQRDSFVSLAPPYIRRRPGGVGIPVYRYHQVTNETGPSKNRGTSDHTYPEKTILAEDPHSRQKLLKFSSLRIYV